MSGVFVTVIDVKECLESENLSRRIDPSSNFEGAFEHTERGSDTNDPECTVYDNGRRVLLYQGCDDREQITG